MPKGTMSSKAIFSAVIPNIAYETAILVYRSVGRQTQELACKFDSRTYGHRYLIDTFHWLYNIHC